MNNQNQSGSIKLGFGLPPTPEYVYANRSKNCLWYFFRDEKVVAIEETALTGYITGVDLVTVERYKADSEKLRIRVRADRQYVIEAGAHSVFAHGFLDAWSVMSDAQKAGAITIEVSPGEKPTVLFCSVFDESGTLIIPGKSGQALPAHDSGLAARVKFIIGLCCEGDKAAIKAAIKLVCKESGLPERSEDFRDESQVLLLRGILFQTWADRQGKNTAELTGLMAALDELSDTEAWAQWKGAVADCKDIQALAAVGAA